MSQMQYTQTRTREQLDELLHYAHPIPVRRGLTRKYVDQHYPGWTFNDLMAVLEAAGIVDRHHMAPADAQLDRLVARVTARRIGQPPVCCADVDLFEFSGPDCWRVHWRSGDTTTRPADGDLPDTGSTFVM